MNLPCWRCLLELSSSEHWARYPTTERTEPPFPPITLSVYAKHSSWLSLLAECTQRPSCWLLMCRTWSRSLISQLLPRPSAWHWIELSYWLWYRNALHSSPSTPYLHFPPEVAALFLVSEHVSPNSHSLLRFLTSKDSQGISRISPQSRSLSHSFQATPTLVLFVNRLLSESSWVLRMSHPSRGLLSSWFQA